VLAQGQKAKIKEWYGQSLQEQFNPFWR